MKTVFFILAILILNSACFSQDLFQTLTNHYADQEGFSATQIPNDMFDLYIKKRHIEDDSPVYGTLKKLDNILIVSQRKVDEKKETNLPALHTELMNYYKKENYTLFKTEKNLDEDLKVYLKKSQDKINSLAMVTASSFSVKLIEMKGEIDLANLSELSKALNIRGLENLYKINNSSNTGSFSFYNYGLPNDFNSGYVWKGFPEEKKKEIEEKLIKQKELSEEQFKELERQAREIAIRKRDMFEKEREMTERYGRQPIFLSPPGDTNTVYYLNGKKVKADKIKELLPDGIESIEINKNKKEDGKSVIKIQTK